MAKGHFSSAKGAHAPNRPLAVSLYGGGGELQGREGLQLPEPRAQRRHVRELPAVREAELQRRASMIWWSGTRRDPGTPRSIFSTLKDAGIQG